MAIVISSSFLVKHFQNDLETQRLYKIWSLFIKDKITHLVFTFKGKHLVWAKNSESGPWTEKISGMKISGQYKRIQKIYAEKLLTEVLLVKKMGLKFI